MTDRQRKILAETFLLLGAAARNGKKKAETATAEQLREHALDMQQMAAELVNAIDYHCGAVSVLKRAKPLSASRPRP